LISHMLAKVLSSSVLGIDAYVVEVEVDITMGLPAFATVGLPDGAVRESKDRVKSAIKNSGYRFPPHRITVNLAPADIKKEGAGFDLPMAMGILAATGLINREKLSQYLVIGELSLDGNVKPTRGALPMALAARNNGFAGIIVPEGNSRESAVVQGVNVFAARHLSQVVDFFNDIVSLPSITVDIADLFTRDARYDVDFNEVKGQEHVKRALEIAAAGGHNVMMVGPPGSGKTMLAQRLMTILPDLTFEEALETTKVYSIMGLMGDRALIATRPFRSPHHTISDAGLIGGGQIPKPGEVSLAHNGVLLLDEMPEFRKNVLEVLRQPMEDGRVTIARAATSITYPARFMAVAAMNPCPCGFYGDHKRQCQCTHLQIQRYRTKVSGPLLDRLDLHVEVPAVQYQDLAQESGGESSKTIRKRVNAARNKQQERYKNYKMYCNAQMPPRLLKHFCRLGEDSHRLLETAIDRLGLSARAHNRILKIGRTIADLEGLEKISVSHIAEGIQYRSLDRNLA